MKKEDTVDYHIKKVWHAISRMYNQGGSSKGITASSGFVMLNIDQDEGTAATKIAPLLGMETRSLSRMLKSMEESGLIYRERDTIDKRSVKIFLTKEGKRKREFSRKAVIYFNQKIGDVVSMEKLTSFFEVMETINNVIDQNKNLDQKIEIIENEQSN
jgi:DNA-binding MarR family transcriptional regulator